MIIRSKFNGYSPDGVRIYRKGGGGGSVKYDELENLYRVQTEQARSLMDQANQNVYPAYNELLTEARGTGSQANQEAAAGRAAADVAAAQGGAKKQLEQQLTSMGVNPNDQKYVNTMAAMDLDAAAQGATAQTGARERTRDLGFAKMTDTVNAGMGIGSNAVGALNSAAGTAGNLASLQQQASASSAQAAGNIAALGTRLLGFKDGGHVKKGCGLKLKGYANGGRVQGTGIMGAMANIKPPAPPVAAPQRQAGGGSPLVGTSGAGTANFTRLGSNIEGVGKLVGKVAPEAGNSIQSFGAGLRLGDAAQPAIEAYKGAAAAGEAATANAANAAATANEIGMAADLAAGTEAAAGTAAAAGEAAGAAAAAGEAAGMAAAGAEAAGATASAMGAGSALATTIGTALPWVGGALLIGSALDLFADGGHVEKKAGGARLVDAVDATAGGAVEGPGGPKDDAVIARLSDGEFVMPVGAVKLYGLKQLEQMRARGLRHEKKLGIK